MKLILIIVLTVLLSCNSTKRISTSGIYNKYYVRFILFKPNNYPISMNGIGGKLNLNLLNMSNQESFIKSFYTQFTYSPFMEFMDDYEFEEISNCLGYEVEVLDLINANFEEKKIKLQNNLFVNIEIYAISDKVNTIEISKSNSCVQGFYTSEEINYLNLKYINKVSLILSNKSKKKIEDTRSFYNNLKSLSVSKAIKNIFS